MKLFSREQTRNLTKLAKNLCSSVFICGLIICFSASFYGLESETETIEKQIDSAIYSREEFFGASAIAPIPTAESYENLLKLSNSNNLKVFEKLAEFAEKLEKFDEAENYLFKTENLDLLSGFYHRRANYAKEAETLEQILKQTKRLDIFEKLIELAQLHELDKYLQPE
jgi:tetratricopeptide (TPR) repeat protein